MRVFRFLSRQGIRRGLLGGSRAWTAIGVGALAFRGFRKITGREPKVVYCEELAPGETLVIRHEEGVSVDWRP